MSRYLCQTQEIYRVGTEEEAAKLIEEAKLDKRFTLLKSSTEYKTVKSKGEIVDEYYKTTLVKHFTDLKEPDCSVEVTYNVEQGYFPDPVSEDTAEDF
jgi:hypothetical protein